MEKNSSTQKKIRILISTVAGPEIGTGHVMRCLSLAQTARKAGAEVLFIEEGELVSVLAAKHGFPCVKKPTRADWLLLDRYDVTIGQMEELTARAKVLYIDDLNMFSYPVHSILNYAVYANQELYKNQKAQLFLGPRYAPLREEFFGLKPLAIKNEVSNIFVTVGGADPLHLAPALCTALCEAFWNCTVHVAVGAISQSAKDVFLLQNTYENLRVAQNAANIAKLMRSCDMAVSAGGSTLYELCACGVPTVSFAMADNQLPNVTAFAASGIIPFAGDVRQDREKFLDNISLQLADMCANPAQRAQQSFAMQKAVDGKGATRVIDCLCGKPREH